MVYTDKCCSYNIRFFLALKAAFQTAQENGTYVLKIGEVNIH